MGYGLFFASNWWEASPNSGNSNNFCNVTSSGTADNNNANNGNGISPFGCKIYRQESNALVKSRLNHTGVHDLALCEISATAWLTTKKVFRKVYKHNMITISPKTDRTVRSSDRREMDMKQPTFEEVFTIEHLLIAANECCRGVRWKTSTQTFEMNMSRWVHNLHKEIHNGTYKSKGFTEFTITERGKVRRIQSVHISERCVQKCLCKFGLKPILTPTLIYDNGANIDGKGTHFAVKRLKKHLAHHYKKHGTNGGILLVDYHDYFGSIDHNILRTMLEKDIQDKRLFNFAMYFVDAFKGDIGLGLGSEVSQILAIYYPSKIDHYIKEQLHIKGYGRYMDDSYLIHEDINYLKECLEVIRKESAKLGLTLNPKSHVVPLCNNFVYLKKRIHYTDTGRIIIQIDKKNLKRTKLRFKKMLDKDYNIYANLESWWGSAKHYNTYRLRYRLYGNLWHRYFDTHPHG